MHQRGSQRQDPPVPPRGPRREQRRLSRPPARSNKGPTLRLRRLAEAGDLPHPRYETEGAAGLDLRAALSESIELAPGARALIPTGFEIAVPAGFEAQVRPRSGLAYRHGVTVLNSPGTIDADYRGHLQVLLINLGDVPFEIARGARVAQLVVAPVAQVACVEVDSLPETARGAGGFGHTGST